MSFYMIADARRRLIHAPGLWDPYEFRDLGVDPACEEERRRLMAALHAWGLRLSQRTTMSEQQNRDRRDKSFRRAPAQLWSQYLGEGQ